MRRRPLRWWSPRAPPPRPPARPPVGRLLQHFAKDTPFVHLDVAGTAMLDKPRRYYSVRGASGRGVRLFADLAHNTAS